MGRGRKRKRGGGGRSRKKRRRAKAYGDSNSGDSHDSEFEREVNENLMLNLHTIEKESTTKGVKVDDSKSKLSRSTQSKGIPIGDMHEYASVLLKVSNFHSVMGSEAASASMYKHLEPGDCPVGETDARVWVHAALDCIERRARCDIVAFAQHVHVEAWTVTGDIGAGFMGTNVIPRKAFHATLSGMGPKLINLVAQLRAAYREEQDAELLRERGMGSSNALSVASGDVHVAEQSATPHSTRVLVDIIGTPSMMDLLKKITLWALRYTLAISMALRTIAVAMLVQKNAHRMSGGLQRAMPRCNQVADAICDDIDLPPVATCVDIANNVVNVTMATMSKCDIAPIFDLFAKGQRGSNVPPLLALRMCYSMAYYSKNNTRVARPVSADHYNKLVG